MKKGSNIILHILQQICLVGGVVALAVLLIGSSVLIKDKNGTVRYSILGKTGEEFEDSELFNKLLGNNVSDIICYGAIRGQMETNGKFDADKTVDVTAFANRYQGLQPEYITAEYRLEDLIKWEQYGFEREEVYMSGQEADRFLSRMRTVTFVEFEGGNYSGGTISYLNSDTEKRTKVIDVSGNVIAEDGEALREDVLAEVLNNRYKTIKGKNIENHVSSWEEYYELCGNIEAAAQDLKINYDEYLKYNEYYDADNTNIVYYIIKTIGKEKQIYSNQEIKSDKLSVLKEALKEKCDKYIVYDPENMVYETNTLIEESTLRYVLKGYEYAYPADTQILIGVAKNYDVADAFTQARAGYNQYSPYFGQYLCSALFAMIIYLFLLVVLTLKEGKVKRKDTGEVVFRLKREDTIPTEIMFALALVVVGCLGGAAEELMGRVQIWSMLDSAVSLILIGAAALLVSLLFSFFYYSLVRRIKAGILWKNSLLKRLICWIKGRMLYMYDNSTVILRVWVPFAAFVLINLGLILLIKEPVGILLALAVDAVVGAVLYNIAKQRQSILKGIKKINDGDMEHQIDKTGLHGDNLVLADAVNSIGEGIRNAVATSMKDERMKADLITNVSHDIKTPLTSIINYVDLIKRENIDNPKVKEYIEILDVKSQRLKQLTDDLVEASKISSGNIILQWEKINLVELLNQTIGEFSEKFEEKSLTPVLRTTKNSVYVEADSRRIWRVIENLFNNVFKYALEGTRVYIDLQEMDIEKSNKQIALSIRNISANPIKVNADELTERFIRGDESRTTEGSGLGLSIAKNLTEVQKGKFEILVDGDLFKVILIFPLLEDK